MPSFHDTPIGLFLAAVIAGYALLFLTILVPGSLVHFSTIILIIALIVIILFSLVIILKALKALL